MSLGECKAPRAVVGGWWVARRVGHSLISLLGPGAWAGDEVSSTGVKGSMGRGRKAGSGGVRRQSSGRGGAGVQASHRKSGGPVARGKGGSGLDRT